MAERSRLITAGSRVRLQLASDEWLVASVRRGDTAAFEALYERHSRELLSFSIYMVGSRQDAEDAVQATFISAYRALGADGRPVALRPWLFTIARNNCLSILRRRRPVVELNGEVAPGPDPLGSLELREEVRRIFEGLRDLPEQQRAALLLAEVHGLSQQEIGTVLGVRADQVKAYIYQARSKLISEKQAREVDCEEIREELATARGAALLRGRLRRHVRSCADCRVYADGVSRQRRQLGALLPVVPSLALKYRALEEALSIGAADPTAYAGGAAVGASAAGAAAEFAGGGFNALLVKVAAGVACLGASAGVGVSVLSSPVSSHGGSSSAATAPSGLRLSASGGPSAVSWNGTALTTAGELNGGGEAGGAGGQPGLNGISGLPEVKNGSNTGPSVTSPNSAGSGTTGAGEESRGSIREHTSKREASQPKSGSPEPKGREEHSGEHGSRAPKTEQEIQERHEARQRKIEGREPKVGSGAPPTEQEIQERHEARKRKLEGREPKVGSGAPPTEQEILERHEARKRKLEARKRAREEEA